jgi:hypothetical protein
VTYNSIPLPYSAIQPESGCWYHQPKLLFHFKNGQVDIPLRSSFVQAHARCCLDAYNLLNVKARSCCAGISQNLPPTDYDRYECSLALIAHCLLTVISSNRQRGFSHECDPHYTNLRPRGIKFGARCHRSKNTGRINKCPRWASPKRCPTLFPLNASSLPSGSSYRFLGGWRSFASREPCRS